MKEEVFDIPDLEDIQDLGSAKFLLDLLVKTLESQRKTLESQRETLALLTHEIAELKRALFGQKSERVIPIDVEISKRKRLEETLEETAARKKKSKQKRDAEREKRREKTPTVKVVHEITHDACALCGESLDRADDLPSEVSEEFEYVPAQVIRREHHRKRKVCPCGCFAVGPAPKKVVEGGLYGPGLHAHVVVAKCADSLPLDRQARAFKRAGVPLSKSTLCDQFHRSAELLSPLADHVLNTVASQGYINADETSLKVQARKVCHRAFVWDFIATNDAGHTMVAYRFSPDRSGQTPIEVLGESTGVLQVDGYTGYNQVTTPKKRKRAGCWAHARRKFFDALKTSPDLANFAIDRIRELYEVEYEAAENGKLGDEQHAALRRTKSRKIATDFFEWVEEEKPKHRPQSPLGIALKYASNQRNTLERFLDDVKIRLDNNLAEQHLRLIALGRKNFLFVGNNEAGKNLAILQTLVSTCLANKVNPQTYLTDVLMRVADTPNAAIDTLMPWNWRPPPTA